jgi:uncharacterized protein YdhG (YjbR/CyaY superfamily)
MVQSKASTVDDYLAELPEERRAVVSVVRDVIRRNLPKGYSETMGYGMITYCIPLEQYPQTYNGQPLCYAGLAAQKNGYSLYLMGPYTDPKQQEAIRKAFEKAGKKLDMGKSCLRFKKAEDLPLADLGKVIAGMPPEQLIAVNEKFHPAKTASKKTATKKK